MKKRIFLVLITGLLTASLLTGCGAKDTIPTMSEEDTELVTAYAVDLIESHNTVTESRLVDTEAETIRRMEIAEKAAQVQALIDAQKQEEKEKQEAEKETPQVVDSTNGSSVAEGNVYADYKDSDMAQLLGLDGFVIKYAGSFLSDEYPGSDAGDWVPTVEATPGKKLMVVSLLVTNESNDAAVFDTLSKNVQGRISDSLGNGGIALTTMLLNDFASSKDSLEAGQTNEYVLVTQVDSSVTEVGQVTLLLKAGGETYNIALG